MNYRKIFTEAFSDVSPKLDEQAAAREIIERGKTMKTTRHSVKKTFTAIAAAAAVALVGGVSVAAATGWSFTAAFDKLFADRAEDVSYVSPIDFSKMGKELDHRFETEDYILNVRGVAATKQSLFLLYDVTFTEEFLLHHDMEGVNVSPRVFFKAEADSSGFVEQYGVNGSTYSFGHLQHWFDKEIEGETIDVRVGSVMLFDREGNETELDCDQKFKLKIDFDVLDEVRTVDLDETIQVGADSVVLDAVVLDPFSVDLRFSFSDLPDAHGALFDMLCGGVYITTVDGERTKLLGPGGTCHNNSDAVFSADHKLPVFPDEVASITFGDYTIPLK